MKWEDLRRLRFTESEIQKIDKSAAVGKRDVADLSKVLLYIQGKGDSDLLYLSLPLDAEEARELGRVLLEQADATDNHGSS